MTFESLLNGKIGKLEGVLYHCEAEQIKNNSSFKHPTKRLDKLEYLRLLNFLTFSLHIGSVLTSASHFIDSRGADRFQWAQVDLNSRFGHKLNIKG